MLVHIHTRRAAAWKTQSKKGVELLSLLLLLLCNRSSSFNKKNIYFSVQKSFLSCSWFIIVFTEWSSAEREREPEPRSNTEKSHSIRKHNISPFCSLFYENLHIWYTTQEHIFEIVKMLSIHSKHVAHTAILSLMYWVMPVIGARANRFRFQARFSHSCPRLHKIPWKTFETP